MHPILENLGLCRPKHSDGDQVRALHVLDLLLHRKTLSEEAVREAVGYLQQAMPRKTSNSNESSSNAATTDVKLDNSKGLEAAKAYTENKKSSDASQPHPSDEISAPLGKPQPPPTSSYRRRHVALRIYYDGAKYTGLSDNVGSLNDQSVERKLFEALQKADLVVDRDSSGYSRCGRTDRGVSAAGQILALKLKSAFSELVTLDQEGKVTVPTENLPKNAFDKITVWVPPRKKKNRKGNTGLSAGTQIDRVQKDLSEYPYDKVLNNLLPPDVRVLGWSPVSEDFSARFSTKTRTYRYFFVRSKLNVGKMRDAIKRLEGRHDFRNFCKMDVEKVYNFERVIHSATIEDYGGGNSEKEEDRVYYFLIHGQAFLWHQIRCIVSVLFLVGQELEKPSVVTELLDAAKYPAKPNFALAPELPLVLHNCGYKSLKIGYSATNLWAVSCHLRAQHMELILAAARIQSCLETLDEAEVQPAEFVKFVNSKLERRRKNLRRVVTEDDHWDNLDFPAIWKDTTLVSWKEAIGWVESARKLIPSSGETRDAAYIPLLERGRGLTYEQKVDLLKQSSKRLQRYEENVVKKRKTEKEDRAFYDHMAEQGGSGT